MFNSIAAQKIEDYFFPKSRRTGDAVYVYRMVGYSEASLTFLSHYYFECRKNGIYIKTPIMNPIEHEVQNFYQTVGTEFYCNKQFILNAIYLWMPQISQSKQKDIADALFVELQNLEKRGSNQNILKNAFIKFMCWLRYKFETIVRKAGEEVIPKILYEGEIGKYELYFLKIVSYLGCDVLLVNFIGDEKYKAIDPKEEYTKAVTYPQKGTPSIHFTKMNWEEKVQTDAIQNTIKGFEGIIETNAWKEGDLLEASLKKNEERGWDKKKIYNFFVLYQGVSNLEEYENGLYQWRLKIENSKKKYVITEKGIEKPSIEEVNNIKQVSYQNKKELIYHLSESIKISQDTTLLSLAKKAFIEIMEEDTSSNLAKLKNKGICLLCWLERYTKGLFQNYNHTTLPMYIHYGSFNGNEGAFFKMLSKMPVDVFLFCPDLEQICEIESGQLVRKLAEHSMPITDFPDKGRKIQVSTVAYQAERELDGILYQDTGLFRNRQFVRSMPVTLRTTYEEIGILWREEAKYRPSFEVLTNEVMIPTIFAKISGVKDGDENTYWKEIAGKITENTILITKVPYLKGTDENPMKPQVVSLYKNGKLQVEKIKAHHAYPYDYLNEKIQDSILDKIQQLIELDWIKSSTQGIEYAIVATLLNLDKETIRLIQTFDFTKEIPKVILVNTRQEMCSLEDAIYIAFLNLVGFDILLYAPTGYRTIEKYFKEEVLKEHEIGDYLFDLTVDNFKLKTIRSANQGVQGMFQKFLGRGRN